MSKPKVKLQFPRKLYDGQIIASIDAADWGKLIRCGINVWMWGIKIGQARP